ncbi:transketolase family protein [Pseudoflavonifractor sp. 60]|uniref:transketolase family protein n=1 Tax=Pseudoflavonifractor sp. 60 TaxID=2304576 RepID=UPI001370BE28|nr:transketolase C-terminal domain-containing protein [Pseudoflavonifractor sp. 60]NBI68991.1 transketolase family protein [Pseudoflavonifractor sp. 60]
MMISQRQAYGEVLAELGKEYENLVVCDADLAHATMTCIFEKNHPDRFYNFGIAEANMVCAAAGMAHNGLMPFVSTFALFGAGRAYEQIRNSVCYANANVKFGLCHAGISTGEDGGSHQSIEDIALMRVLPNMKIFVPCDAVQLKQAVRTAAKTEGPVYVRIARPPRAVLTPEDAPFVPGQAHILRQGSDICLMASGLMVEESLKAAELLEREGIHAAVVNHISIKPFDWETTLAFHAQMPILTVEEHSVIGGLGSAAAEVIAGVPGGGFGMVGIIDKFGRSGKPEDLFQAYGLTPENICRQAKALL